MTQRHNIAVIDIGKTNVKLALVDLNELAEIAVITRRNRVIEADPWPHFDVEGHWQFLLNGLAQFHQSHGIDGISITTHGACAALLDRDGNLAAPILDYEYEGQNETRDAYAAIRPDFAETGSPFLAKGLNLGAQLYWQFYKDPTLFERTDKIVTYPQYWAFLLTGAVAADVSSLGCHTDLWAPDKRDYSSLVDHMQLRDKLAAPENANKIIGTVTPEICKLTGLPRHVPVACGIHDSNASLLPYLNTDADQYSVVSTGTWVIAMALNGPPIELDEALETFMNVDAFGRPVPSARFMGGREFELEKSDISSEYSDEEVQAVLDDQLMLLPAVEPMAGPFKSRLAEWQPYAPERDDPRRHIALSFYLALVTNSCLEAIGHVGKIVVEGPFARNELFLSMLKVASNSEVFLSSGQTGTSLGAALLFKKRKSNKPKTRHIIAPTWDVAAMREHAENWRYLTNSKTD